MSSTSTSVMSKPKVNSKCCDSMDSSETPSSDSCLRSEVKAEPFQDLKLASHKALEKAQLKGRLKCPRCHGSRMFYCYTCFSLVGVNQQEIPKLKLPVKIDIIKHPNETDGKSTAVHAKLLAPDDVTIYTFPCIPEYDSDKVVLVFPGPESVTVEEMAARLTGTLEDRQGPSPEEPRAKRVKREDQPSEGGSVQPHNEATAPPLTRVVFIDSTWNQTNKIITDERLQALLQVELKTRKTCFWRHQKGSPDTYLATIEAIYYFLKDYHTQCLSKDYDGDYDDLLYFFTYLHKLISGAKHAAGKL